MSGSYNQFFRDAGPDMMDPFLGPTMYGDDNQIFSQQMFGNGMGGTSSGNGSMNAMNSMGSNMNSNMNGNNNMNAMNSNNNNNNLNVSRQMGTSPNMGNIGNGGSVGNMGTINMGNAANMGMNEPFQMPMKRSRDGTASPNNQRMATPLPSQLLQEAHSGSSSPIMQAQPQGPYYNQMMGKQPTNQPPAQPMQGGFQPEFFQFQQQPQYQQTQSQQQPPPQQFQQPHPQQIPQAAAQSSQRKSAPNMQSQQTQFRAAMPQRQPSVPQQQQQAQPQQQPQQMMWQMNQHRLSQDLGRQPSPQQQQQQPQQQAAFQQFQPRPSQMPKQPPQQQQAQTQQQPLPQPSQQPVQSSPALQHQQPPVNRQQAMSQAQSRQEAFMKSLLEFMHRRGTPITEFPTICGKRVNLLNMYITVHKLGGSMKISQNHQWAVVARALGFDLSMDPVASQEIYASYMKLLQPFEEALLASQQARARARSAGSPQLGVAGGVRQSPQNMQGPQVPPQGIVQGPQQGPQQQPHMQKTLPMQQQSPQQPQAQQQSMMAQPIGQLPQQRPEQQSLQSPMTSAGEQIYSPAPAHQPSPALSHHAVSSHASPISQYSPAQQHRSPSQSSTISGVAAPSQQPQQSSRTPILATRPSPVAGPAAPVQVMEEPVHRLLNLPHDEDNKYVPKTRLVEKHGGNDIRSIGSLGMEIEQARPEFPLLFDLGSISVHALTMSLKSMVAGEVRQALDKLIVCTADQRFFLNLHDAPGLLSALCEVGLNVVEKLDAKKFDGSAMRGTKTINLSSDTEDNDDDALLREWKQKCGDGAIVLTVDAATGHEEGRKVPESLTIPDVTVHAAGTDSTSGTSATGKSRKPAATNGCMAASKGSPFRFANYLDLFQAARHEAEDLRAPLPSTEEYWMTSMVHRLLSVTTILRNVSCMVPNLAVIVGNPTSMGFIYKLLRSLGTNPDLIPAARSRLDLMKDLLLILSNIAPYVVLDSPADTFTLILFLLSFSPADSPYDSEGNVNFGQYSTSIHRYLPYAVDVLAKLIPRDPPNRDIIKSVLLNSCNTPDFVALWRSHYDGASDGGNTIPRPYDLLTKCFGMAICTVPHNDLRIVPRGLELLRPLLHQSLLLAEILAEIVPFGRADDETHEKKNKKETAENDKDAMMIDDSDDDTTNKDINAAPVAPPAIESTPDEDDELNTDPILSQVRQAQRQCNLAQMWLSSVDGFAPVLLRAACALGAVVGTQNVPGRQEELNPFARITQRSVTILRILGKKAMRGKTILPTGVLPTIELLLGAMLAGDMDKYVVRQICAFCDDGNEHWKSVR